jgi:hypothetical protein
MFTFTPAVIWSAHMRAMSLAFCAEDPTSSVQSHYCISSKTCAVPYKAAAICEILSVQMTNRLVKHGWLENTSFITSEQSCSGGPESTGSRVAKFRVLTTFSQIHGFLHNML